MKVYTELEVHLHFYPRLQMEVSGQYQVPVDLLAEKNLVTHCIGRWVDHIAGLDGLGKGKSLAHAGIRTPDCPARS